MQKTLRRSIQILTGVGLGLVIAFVLVRSSGPEEENAERQGSYFLPNPLPAPEFTLTSHHGVQVSSGSFPGKTLVVFFGYTYCPDVCPLTLSNLARAFQAMGESGEMIQVLLISVDPHRDSPERMETYLANFHPSFLGLTGSLKELRGVADGFGAYFSEPTQEEGYTVDHTARAFVVDRFGRIPLTFPVTATPDEMARDLTRVLEDSGA